MARLDVTDSSLLTRAEYSYGTARLDLTLVNGVTYRYYDVSDGVWRAVRKAANQGTVGSYVSRNVLRAGYKTRKLARR